MDLFARVYPTLRYQRRHKGLTLTGGSRRERRHRARIIRLLRRFGSQSPLTRLQTAREADRKRGLHVEAIRAQARAHGLEVSQKGWLKYADLGEDGGVM